MRSMKFSMTMDSKQSDPEKRFLQAHLTQVRFVTENQGLRECRMLKALEFQH